MAFSSSGTKFKPIIASKSSVDESLFSSPARFKQMTGKRTGTTSSEVGAALLEASTQKQQGTRRKVTSDAEVFQIITKDLIRTMKVHSIPDPSGETIVMNSEDYKRIMKNAQVTSLEDQKELENIKMTERNLRVEAANIRKREMQVLELSRRKHEKLSDLEQEAIEKGSEQVAQAKSMLEEQDDEIKKLNETILNAKCHAIRDNQLQEKKEIVKSLQEEEIRLDAMVEVKRLQDIEKHERREKEQQLQRLKGAEVIKNQIKAREQQRLLNAEKKDQETQAMLRYLDRLQEEDMDAMVKKKTTQRLLMEEVSLCNQEILRQRDQEKEHMKFLDRKVQDYLKEKAKREEDQQAELAKIKNEKEREVAQLRAQQERAQDKQAEKDTLRAKRRQEEFEREARRKEKQEAEKKWNTEQMLIDSRQRQIQQKEHFYATQAKQDRDEFNRVLKIQQELMESEKVKQEEAAKNRQLHARDVRKQVREKEEGKIASRRAFFDEGVRLDFEAKERKRKLDEIKQRKLAELRAVGIPDKYCAQISRRITAPPTYTFADRF